MRPTGLPAFTRTAGPLTTSLAGRPELSVVYTAGRRRWSVRPPLTQPSTDTAVELLATLVVIPTLVEGRSVSQVAVALAGATWSVEDVGPLTAAATPRLAARPTAVAAE